MQIAGNSWAVTASSCKPNSILCSTAYKCAKLEAHGRDRSAHEVDLPAGCRQLVASLQCCTTQHMAVTTHRPQQQVLFSRAVLGFSESCYLEEFKGREAATQSRAIRITCCDHQTVTNSPVFHRHIVFERHINSSFSADCV